MKSSQELLDLIEFTRQDLILVNQMCASVIHALNLVNESSVNTIENINILKEQIEVNLPRLHD